MRCGSVRCGAEDGRRAKASRGLFLVLVVVLVEQAAGGRRAACCVLRGWMATSLALPGW